MNILIMFILGSSIASSADSDSDGWVAVAKPSSEMISAAQEQGSGIWVVFSTQLGPEKMLVRFPEEPSYFYKESGEMEIFAHSKGDECRLQILEKTFESPEELLESRQSALAGAVVTRSESRMDESGPLVELTYWKEGAGHQERWISTKHHTYFFSTKTASMDLALHNTFISSFDVEQKHS